MIFHAIFFLRIWRKWISKSSYVLREHFITSNAYLCTEINGENLLKLIRIFRNENKRELFSTTLFDSQACERVFRQLRSMGGPNFTKMNFYFRELVYMVKRIELQNEILYSKLPHDIDLPKLKKKPQTTNVYALPTEEEINECLSRAKRFVINDACQFEMHINCDEIDVCEIAIPNRLEKYVETDDDNDWENEVDQMLENEDVDMEDDILSEQEEEDHQHKLVTTTDQFGQQCVIGKDRFVWELCEGTKKMSSDRLIRVQETSVSVKPGAMNEPSMSSKVYKAKYIKLGDWCFFKVDVADKGEMICIGLLHAIKFANRTSKKARVKDKIYKFDSINLLEKANSLRELEVLSTWYMINEQGTLVPTNLENHKFISMEKYVATASIHPTIDPDVRRLFFCKNDLKEIEDDLLKLTG